MSHAPHQKERKKSEILLSSFQQTKKEKQNSAYVPRRVGGGQVSAGVTKTKKKNQKKCEGPISCTKK